jgi:hypothetical protein
MRCFLCTGASDIKLHKGRAICRNCFCKLLEKRIRKNARVNKLFSKGDRILAIGDVNRYLVKSILKELPAKLFFKSKEDKGFVKKNNINKIVLQWTLDDEANKFMKAVFEARKVKPMPKQYVKLMMPATDKEIEMFAKFKKLKFKPSPKDALVQLILDEVENRHPNMKFNLLKNVELLNRLTDKP